MLLRSTCNAAVYLGVVSAMAAQSWGQCVYNWRQPQGTPGLQDNVVSMMVWDPDGAGPSPELLFIGVNFVSPGGVTTTGIALWDGATWQPLGTGLSGATPFAAVDMTVFNGELIAGGGFTAAGNVTTKYIACWNGTSWGPMGTGLGYWVYAVEVYNGELIAGGWFSTAGGVSAKYIARWNGATWQPMGTGMNNPVYSMSVYKGELIVAGDFTTAGGVSANRTVRWNGTAWQPLGTGMNHRVRALTEYKGELIAAGDFTTASGVSAKYIARWNGTVWQPLGTGLSSPAYTLAVYNGELIAGGSFTSAGGASANYIARWNGTAWQPLGTGLGWWATSLTNYYGELFVGGNFSTAGGQPSPYLAVWGPVGPAPQITQQPPSPLVCQNSAVTLHAAAAGQGNLTYQWQKSGVDLADTPDRFGTQSQSLVFAHAGPADSGDYKCVVMLNNCTQASTSTANLTVFPTGSADGNADMLADGRDIAAFVDALVNYRPVSQTTCAFDLTSDGVLNIADVDDFVARLLTGA